MRSTAACSLCILAFTAPAIAQDAAAAAALFDRGLAEMDAGRYDTGCPMLAESRRLDPRAGTVFTLAECEAKWGHLATASRIYDDYLSLFARMPLSDQEKQAQRARIANEQRAAFAPKIPRLTLKLGPGVKPDTVVTRDGAPVPPALLGAAQLVDPGEHTITASAPGSPGALIKVTLAPGEVKELVLDPRARAGEPPADTSKPPEETMHRRSIKLMIGGIVTMGAGVIPLIASPFVYLFGCAERTPSGTDTTFKSDCGAATAAIAMAISGGVLIVGGAVMTGVGATKVPVTAGSPAGVPHEAQPAAAAWIPAAALGPTSGSLRWTF